MSKGKTLVFVDTENVGHSIPLKLPKSVKVYFYIKDKNILPKVYPNCMHKRVKLIDLASKATKTKNEMDLALMTQLSIAIAKHGRKRKYVILSNDKGYDYPIVLLRRTYGVELTRVCCSLEEFINPLNGESEPEADEKTKESAEPAPAMMSEQLIGLDYDPVLFRKCRNFEDYRKAQKTSQKKRLRKNRKVFEKGSSVWMEYDPYAKVWVPFVFGKVMTGIDPDPDAKKVAQAQTRWIEQQNAPAQTGEAKAEDQSDVPVYDLALFERYQSFEKYRKAQNNAKKKKLRRNRQMFQGALNAWIEYDPYGKQWVPFASGAKVEAIAPDPDPEALSVRLKEWIEMQEQPKTKKTNEEIDFSEELFRTCDSFEQYRSAQKNALKKQLRKNRLMYRGGPNLWAEYDPYAKVWVPFVCGMVMEEIEPDPELKNVTAAQNAWLAVQPKEEPKKKGKKAVKRKNRQQNRKDIVPVIPQPDFWPPIDEDLPF